MRTVVCNCYNYIIKNLYFYIILLFVILSL
nr:MAG TPA: hypothetical protein [Caudoviricetes sp.]